MLHPAPQSGLSSTGKATVCHSGAPRRRRRHPVPVLWWQPHSTVTASPLASSHRLMPSNHTMFQHKAARCSLSHAAPRAPASPLPLPSPSLRSWKAQAPRWLPVCRHPTHTCSVPRRCATVTAIPRVHAGYPTRGSPGSRACRARRGAAGNHRSGLAQTPPRRAGICSRSTRSPVVTLTPSWPPSQRHSVALSSAGNLLCKHRQPPPPRKA